MIEYAMHKTSLCMAAAVRPWGHLDNNLALSVEAVLLSENSQKACLSHRHYSSTQSTLQYHTLTGAVQRLYSAWLVWQYHTGS
jgi:hypothetical protein